MTSGCLVPLRMAPRVPLLRESMVGSSTGLMAGATAMSSCGHCGLAVALAGGSKADAHHFPPHSPVYCDRFKAPATTQLQGLTLCATARPDVRLCGC